MRIMTKIGFIGAAIMAVALPISDLHAQEGENYADQVVSYKAGNPPPDSAHTNPQDALGKPNYVFKDFTGFVSLGCKGELILKFTDNSLVDGPGDDLQIVEVGPIMEATQVAISTDGNKWIKLGKLKGSAKSIDLAGKAQANTDYPWVRLRDASNKKCKDKTAGADIDAIVALNGKSTLVTAQTGIGQRPATGITYPDKDGDNHIDAAYPGGDDCDDNDPNRFPGNLEVADPAYHDEDCDPTTYGELDADGDGYISNQACNRDEAGTLICGPDCDDSDRTNNPLTTPACNGETTTTENNPPEQETQESVTPPQVALPGILKKEPGVIDLPVPKSDGPDPRQIQLPKGLPGVSAPTQTETPQPDTDRGQLPPQIDGIQVTYFPNLDLLEFKALGINLPNPLDAKAHLYISDEFLGTVRPDLSQANGYTSRVKPSEAFREAYMSKPDVAKYGVFLHSLDKERINFSVEIPPRPDKDGDGRVDAAYRDAYGYGDDCDDNDPNRFPGNVEVADAAHHDEDCDPTTYGMLDEDGDGYVSNQACNRNEAGQLICGPDCDDSDKLNNPLTTPNCSASQ